jgi:hypothetical protein
MSEAGELSVGWAIIVHRFEAMAAGGGWLACSVDYGFREVADVPGPAAG